MHISSGGTGTAMAAKARFYRTAHTETPATPRSYVVSGFSRTGSGAREKGYDPFLEVGLDRYCAEIAGRPPRSTYF